MGDTNRSTVSESGNRIGSDSRNLSHEGIGSMPKKTAGELLCDVVPGSDGAEGIGGPAEPRLRFERTSGVVELVEETLSRAGFDGNWRIMSILKTPGPVADALFADIVLDGGGFVAIVERRGQVTGAGDTALPAEYRHTQTMLVVFDQAGNPPDFWI